MRVDWRDVVGAVLFGIGCGAVMVAFIAVLYHFFPPKAHADEFTSDIVIELAQDCRNANPPGKNPRGAINVLPVIGGALDGAADRAVGGPARRQKIANDAAWHCLHVGIKALADEAEREQERAEALKIQRCSARNCAPNEEWQDYCSFPGVPELRLCPK